MLRSNFNKNHYIVTMKGLKERLNDYFSSNSLMDSTGMLKCRGSLRVAWDLEIRNDQERYVRNIINIANEQGKNPILEIISYFMCEHFQDHGSHAIIKGSEMDYQENPEFENERKSIEPYKKMAEDVTIIFNSWAEKR